MVFEIKVDDGVAKVKAEITGVKGKYAEAVDANGVMWLIPIDEKDRLK